MRCLVLKRGSDIDYDPAGLRSRQKLMRRQPLVSWQKLQLFRTPVMHKEWNFKECHNQACLEANSALFIELTAVRCNHGMLLDN